MPDPAPPPHQAPSDLAWSHRREQIALLLRGATWRVSVRASLVVGTVLTIVNQGDRLLAGDVDLVTALRIVANFAIPYVVAGVGYLSGYRTATAR